MRFTRFLARLVLRIVGCGGIIGGLFIVLFYYFNPAAAITGDTWIVGEILGGLIIVLGAIFIWRPETFITL